MPEPLPNTVSSPRTLVQKTARALAWAVVFGAALQWAPGLEPLRWMPDDPMAFVPGLFRPAGEAPETEEDAPGEIDDAQMMVALGPRPADPPSSEGDIPVGLRPSDTMTSSDDPEDEDPLGDDDAEMVVVDSAAALPPPPQRTITESGVPLLPIEGRLGAMDRFYRALARVEADEPGSFARVVHYGDSLITGDYVTQTARRLLQKSFGDGGHGFVLAGKPSPWYRRDNLILYTSDGWDVHRLTRPPISDGAYGLGGSTVRTRKRGQWLRVSPKKLDEDEQPAPGEPYPTGTAVSKIQVMYLAQPKGGRFKMGVGPNSVIVDTDTEAAGARVAEIQLPEGPHTFELRTLGGGEVRLFGAVLERAGPGVVYDSLGLDGGRAKLLRRFDPEHWSGQLRARQPDLLVLHYGTNESQFARLSSKRYRAHLTGLVGQLRASLPGVACLLVGPMDRAEKHPKSGKLVTRPVVKRIVRVQREVAWRQGCGFWNTYEAMGGEGSMARWYRMRPKLASGDLTHPTRRGADRIGAMLYVALMHGYRDYVERQKPAVMARRAKPAAPVEVGAAADAAPAPSEGGSAAPGSPDPSAVGAAPTPVEPTPAPVEPVVEPIEPAPVEPAPVEPAPEPLELPLIELDDIDGDGGHESARAAGAEEAGAEEAEPQPREAARGRGSAPRGDPSAPPGAVRIPIRAPFGLDRADDDAATQEDTP